MSYREFATDRAMLAAYFNGEIDACIGVEQPEMANEVALHLYASHPMYICTSLRRADLFDELEKAIDEVCDDFPKYMRMISEHRYGERSEMAALTLKEAEWLHERVKDGRPVLVDFSPWPFSIYDGDGKMTGLADALLSEIARKTGLKLKAAPQTGIQTAEATHTLTLDVSDTGYGISDEKMSRLFDPFVQDIASRMRNTGGGGGLKGTGLGLPIVKRMVESAQGTIAAKSELGKGTAFHIEIPGLKVVARLSSVPRGGRPPGARGGGEPPGPGGGHGRRGAFRADSLAEASRIHHLARARRVCRRACGRVVDLPRVNRRGAGCATAAVCGILVGMDNAAPDRSGRGMLEPGDMFGDYTVEKLLGKGGMGAVYLVRAPGGARYAVKVMFPDKVTHDLRRRFANEAEFAIRIRHRNIVSVYDVGEDPETGLCYMIMDYVPGGSLADLLERRGRLPIGEAVSIASQVAAALDVAHRHGLVHRDVKPDNILFDSDGTPRLADLGVARFDESQKTTVTTTGMVIGTPAYMAPEQMLNSHAIDARADIYSLGIVLYEMLSGRRPNEGCTAIELMAKAIKGDPLPDIKTICPELSAAVAHAVAFLCAPKPEGRPATALAAGQLLQKAATGRLVLPRKPPRAAVAAAYRAHGRKWLWGVGAAVGIAALFVFGAGVLSFLRSGRNSARPPAGVAGTAPTRPAAGVAGTMVAFSILDRSPTAWAYSFEEKPGWEEPGFDDSGWKRAPGGFGVVWSLQGRYPLPSAHINTLWTTKNLYVRRHFNWSGGDVSRVAVDLFHDEGARIYLNGRLVLEVNGVSRDWDLFEIPVEVFAPALKNGDNVICAKVHNGAYDAYFDCGLVVESGGTPASHAGPDAVHKIKTDAGTWTVAVRNGVAQIGIGGAKELALEPRPKGRLKIPAKLGGFAIRRLAQDCFRDCGELESVEIPEGVRSIDMGAFCGCGRLTNVALPSSLEHVGRGAFFSTPLRSIDLKNVRMLNDGAFVYCNNLDAMTVSPDNPRFYLEDGVLYDRIRRAIVFCPRSRTEYAFPDGIEEIYPDAFKLCKLKRIEIPETVKFVGHHAFVDCPLLESAVFAGDDAHIQEGVFLNTPSLRNVALPKRLKSLEAPYIFRNAGIESIALPDTVEVIGDAVFENCRRLKRIALGKSLRKVGHRVFSGCRELQRFSKFPGTLKELGAEVFRDCVSLKAVMYEGDAPKLVDQNAECLGRNLYRGTNPALVTLARKDAAGWPGGFVGRQRKAWPVGGGENARDILRFTQAAERRESEAAGEAAGTGPKKNPARPKAGVTDRRVRYAKVGSHTWYYTLDNGEAVIWRGHYGYNNETRPAVDPSTDEELVVPSELDGHKVKAIGCLAFFRCRAMKSIVIPEGVREIHGWGFYSCESLKNVRLPSSLRRIGNAFDRCKSLETIDIRDCTDVSGLSFGWCPSLKSVTVSRTNPAYIEIDGALYTKDRETLVFFPRTATSVSLPNFVKKIGKGAFYSSEGLTSVCIPENVVEVGVSAFAWCGNLADVRIQHGLKSVGSSAFSSCQKLRSIDFPASLERVGDTLFDRSMNLERVVFRGDAPLFNDSRQNSLLGKTAPSLVIAVRRGSRGWKTRGSAELPEVWPAEGFEESRPIKFIDQTVLPARPAASAQPAAPAQSAQAKPSGRAWIRPAAGAARTTTAFPILDRSPSAWAYSFEEENGWEKERFDDSRWRRAPGGFGHREELKHLPRARVNTEWRSDRIFLRKRFTWDGGDVSRVVVEAYLDDEATIWLNGRLMLTVNGANFDWQPFEIPAKRFANAVKKGENVLCVEARDHGACSYFDCGLVVECGGAVASHAGPDGMRKVKTAVGTWTVVVKDGVAQIGDGRNVALEPRPKGRLKIPSELDGLAITRLARDCFIRCQELEGVEIAEGVRSIGEGAFFDCTQLADVEIPATLEHIGPRAMPNTRLKRVDLKNVRLMEDDVFRLCDKLENVTVNPRNVTFRVKDGVLYNSVRRAVVFCPSSRRTYAFPAGIEEICSSAFRRTKLKKVVIPSSVGFVGWDAFMECPLLESVEFHGSDAIIRGGAFAETPLLRTVVLPSRLKALDDWAIFARAGQLESIVLPDTVEIIDVAVFESCPRLKSVVLGKSLRTVRHHAFAGCPNLASVVFPPSLKEMGAEVFLDCSRLKRVAFAGNAPTLLDQGAERFGRNLYKGSSPSLVTFAAKGSTGWLDDTDKLPRSWPLDGGENARPIRNGRMR